MIDVKAEDYARELFDEADLRHLRLEEVELSEDGRQWKVTLGWVEPAVARPGLMINGTVHKLPRVYKLFEVDAETGAVSSMKIRNLN